MILWVIFRLSQQNKTMFLEGSTNCTKFWNKKGSCSSGDVSSIITFNQFTHHPKSSRTLVRTLPPWGPFFPPNLLLVQKLGDKKCTNHLREISKSWQQRYIVRRQWLGNVSFIKKKKISLFHNDSWLIYSLMCTLLAVWWKKISHYQSVHKRYFKYFGPEEKWSRYCSCLLKFLKMIFESCLNQAPRIIDWYMQVYFQI